MKEIDFSNVFIPEIGVLATDTFSKAYPVVNNYMLNNLKYQNSRAGVTKEVLDFKTILSNPYRRCVGGFKRDINVFFLLAEAMWIFHGDKDVKFLTLFNKKMSDFSDDGVVFHAPYGFRLRHWGVRSEDKFIEENLHASQGYDQVYDSINIFAENHDTRQVVLQIWNPDLDLGVKSKDLPCNDMVMLKIRDGKLRTTIQNRSNDLHWGLPTNIFQFSFLTELIAGCLGVELGTQVHNSHSLHIYEWNDIATTMDEEVKKADVRHLKDLYSYCKEQRIDLNFTHDVPGNRLHETDFILGLIISNLKAISNGVSQNSDEILQVKSFSNYLWVSYELCKIYIEYKRDLDGLKLGEIKINEVDPSNITKIKETNDQFRRNALDKIEELHSENDWDIIVLAKNFFAKRIEGYDHSFLGKL